MEMNLLVTGAVKENYLIDGINIYLNRIKHYSKINIIEIEYEKIDKNLSKANKKQLLAREGKRIISQLAEHTYIIALDVKGKPMTSKGLAKSIQNLQVQGYSEFTFLIGGAMGLSQVVLDEVDYQLSLSHMTFTHQMIRLILLEQIYRALKIKRGEPYHR